MGTHFTSLAHTPTTHFRLLFYASLTWLLENAFPAFGSPSATLEQFPFLACYLAELPDSIREPMQTRGVTAWWSDILEDWERPSNAHLPLRALRASAGLDFESLMLLFTIGMVDEDARFGPFFEAIQALPGQRRPVLGMMNGWWHGVHPDQSRARLRRLIELGLVQVSSGLDPAPERSLLVPAPIWDALRGEAPITPIPWLKTFEIHQTADLDTLILPEAVRQSLPMLSHLLGSGEVSAIVIRGPRRNGRRTLLRALAKSIGRNGIEIGKRLAPGDEPSRIVGLLATLGNAMPYLVLDLAPGETAEIPPLTGYQGPIGVAMGRQGGLAGPGVERSVMLSLPLPEPDARRRHWSAGFGPRPVEDLDTIATRFRMTVGHIRDAAALAGTRASLVGRHSVTGDDVRQACRTLNRQTLDTLATYIESRGRFDDLAVSDATQRQLLALMGRCRFRESLAGFVGPLLARPWNCGVRALFSGPSGTGKTFAARLIANALHMDLYRLDLASVVNKYIGETEKNLDQVFARAEELDVVLLIDEGDALLTQRTNVQTSNDRYANLETNYLLQRLESFEGILIVTTNAGDRIDSAFKRRLDVVIEFHPPEPAERWLLWQRHLPESHGIETRLLEEITVRCQLTGGQIRNAVLYAAVLALEEGQILLGSHLEAAVQLEYEKQGAICPLRGRT